METTCPKPGHAHSSLAVIFRLMFEESYRRRRRIAALRESIAAGLYQVPAAALANAILRSMLR
jgi:anti-sigma28 factor (negative regulator of flagellin synthesis)